MTLPAPVRRRTRLASAAFVVAAAVAVPVAAPHTADAATLAQTLQTQVDSLVDAKRARAGCGPLAIDVRLTLAAQRHAVDMATKKYFSHTSLNGTTWIQRIKATGYPSPAGENIARGYSTATAVVTAWMNSYGHRKNLLNCKFKRVGVGYAGPGHYWVQDFGY